VPPVRPLAVSVALVLAAAAACAHPLAVAPKVAGCPGGTFAIGGVCLQKDDAAEHCGKAARPEAGGCAPVACDSGEPVDLATGECVPVLALRKLAADHHVPLKGDSVLGCPGDGASLVVDGPSFACLPRAATCGRGASWSEGACHPDDACPPGSVVDPAVGCVPVVRRDHGEEVLDVGAWIRAVVGPDGGLGTRAICGPLAERPWLAGVAAHGSSVVEVRAEIVFPDNEVSEARVAVTGRKLLDLHSADPNGPVPVSELLDPVWKTLRAMKGVASAASATVRVRCVVDGGSTAAATPRPGADGGTTDGGSDPAPLEDGGGKKPTGKRPRASAS